MTIETVISSLVAEYKPEVGSDDVVVPPESKAVLFITDEVFLPQVNGSAQVYTSLARQYQQAGKKVYCLSFFRDYDSAFADITQDEYAALFSDHLLLPGWNRGGGLLGAAGMSWRELSRWCAGNVFATHPFLSVSQRRFADQLLGFIARNNIDEIYFHKVHTLLLLEPLLPRLRNMRLVVDIHDDFVARDAEYAAAYSAVFGVLPWPEILRQHPSMYMRQRFTHTNQRRSRQREMSLLKWCHKILVASEREYTVYAGFPELAGRVCFQPWPYALDAPIARVTEKKPFDAGFIGADNVMNLDAVLYLRDSILPRVLARRPNFRMLLAGTMTRKTATLLSGTPGVKAWDRLEHVADFYAAVSTAAVPIRRGTGVSVKAIEALAHCCSLVTTSMGVRGLPQAMLQQHDVTIADNPVAFAEALLQ